MSLHYRVESFNDIISAVTGFGFFVELAEIHVVGVDLDEKKIDFELVKKEAAAKKAGGAPGKKKRRKKPAK